MARVISKAAPKYYKIAIFECKCGSTVEFSELDILSDEFGPYCVCPSCYDEVSTKTFVWAEKPKRVRKTL